MTQLPFGLPRRRSPANRGSSRGKSAGCARRSIARKKSAIPSDCRSVGAPAIALTYRYLMLQGPGWLEGLTDGRQHITIASVPSGPLRRIRDRPSRNAPTGARRHPGIAHGILWWRDNAIDVGASGELLQSRYRREWPIPHRLTSSAERSIYFPRDKAADRRPLVASKDQTIMNALQTKTRGWWWLSIERSGRSVHSAAG